MNTANLNATNDIIEIFKQHRRVLLAFSHELVSLQDVPAIAAAACRAACDLSGARYASVVILDREQNRFLPAAYSGWSLPEALAAKGIQNDMDTEPGYTAQLREPVVVDDLDNEARFQVPAYYHTHGIVTGITLPMFEHDQVVGVTSIHHDAPRDWSEEDREALQFLANLTATAILHCQERERAEQAMQNELLAAEEARLKGAALDATDDMVVITDLHGKVEYVNPAFEQHTGYTRDEVMGTHFSFMKSQDAAPDLYHEIWETLCTGRTWKGVVINDRKNGEDYREEQTITPVKGGDGHIQHFVAIKRVMDTGGND